MSNRDREDLRGAGQDAALERAWRDGSAEQPSARVDAAILVAAHKAVTDRSRVAAVTPARDPPRQRWSRWAPMAAAAAVAGLAFMLVQTLPRDPDRARPPAARESAKATAAPTGVKTPAPAQSDLAERQPVESSRSGDSDSPVAQEQTGSPGVTAAPSLDPAPPAAMPAENSAGAIAAAPQVPSVGSNESRGDAGAKRGQAVDSTATGEVASPEEWVTRILALHDAGDIAAAADVLRAFRAAVPDADRYLPESLREWAALVR
jgi:hypothetical protein